MTIVKSSIAGTTACRGELSIGLAPYWVLHADRVWYLNTVTQGAFDRGKKSKKSRMRAAHKSK